MKRITKLLVAGLAAVTGTVGAVGVASAATYFNGPQNTTSCPNGYACVEGFVRTQGYNYGTTEFGWYPISFADSESNPTRYVRNRNGGTMRPVDIWRANSGGGYTCRELVYDNRGWVASDLTNATYMNVDPAGYSCSAL